MISRKQIIWGVVFFLLFLTGVSGCTSYNKMVSLDEDSITAWSQVENVYQRRADLIPNLVNTVKGYAAHEKETLTAVIEARAKATSTTIDPSNMTMEQIQQFQANQDNLTSALSKLMVVIERYPDLKANQNFLSLQAELAGTENRIAVERKNFNEVTNKYNKKIRRFPSNLWAGLFGFERRNTFEAKEGSDVAPVVEF